VQKTRLAMSSFFGTTLLSLCRFSPSLSFSCSFSLLLILSLFSFFRTNLLSLCFASVYLSLSLALAHLFSFFCSLSVLFFWDKTAFALKVCSSLPLSLFLSLSWSLSLLFFFSLSLSFSLSLALSHALLSHALLPPSPSFFLFLYSIFSKITLPSLCMH